MCLVEEKCASDQHHLGVSYSVVGHEFSVNNSTIAIKLGVFEASPVSQWLKKKKSTYNAGAAGDPALIPGSGRAPWTRKWRPTPVLLPRESHGQRSLSGYSP